MLSMHFAPVSLLQHQLGQNGNSYTAYTRLKLAFKSCTTEGVKPASMRTQALLSVISLGACKGGSRHMAAAKGGSVQLAWGGGNAQLP